MEMSRSQMIAMMITMISLQTTQVAFLRLIRRQPLQRQQSPTSSSYLEVIDFGRSPSGWLAGRRSNGAPNSALTGHRVSSRLEINSFLALT
jgi:hypothetical protein